MPHVTASERMSAVETDIDAEIDALERIPTVPGDEGRHWRAMLRTGVVVLVAFLVIGNGVIMASMLWYRVTSPAPADLCIEIDNFRAVDDRLYRGAAPDPDDYPALAELGVTTVIDLRAEADPAEAELAAAAGLDRIAMPVRDGQLPSEAQAAELLTTVDGSVGPVFLHCGAGVGRTGAMVAYYLHATGQAEGAAALRHNLSVGPPSLEQLAFSYGTRDGEYRRPGLVVTGLSRFLDGPRRISHNVF